MRTIDANRRGATILGKYDEYNVTVVRFDVSTFVAEYPGCTITLTHRRARDPIAMPVGSFEVIGGTGYWTVARGDTIYVGRGEAEIDVVKDGQLRKSITYETLVVEAPTEGDPEPEEPFKSWVDKVLEAAGHIEGHLKWENIENKPEVFPPEDHTHDADDLTYTEKSVHTPGSIGEAIAKMNFCRVHIVEELPEATEDVRGHFMILLGTENDKIYMCMKVSGTLTWVLLHDPSIPDTAKYDDAKYDTSTFT